MKFRRKSFIIVYSNYIYLNIFTINFLIHGDRSSVGRAPDCDSGGRGFKPRRSPIFS